MQLNIVMKTKEDVKKTDDFSHIINHMVDVSDVYKIRFNGSSSYCFTVSLDDNNFINITREYNLQNSSEILKEINSYRMRLLSGENNPNLKRQKQRRNDEKINSDS